MRHEIVVEGKNVTTDLSFWTGYFKIEVNGRKVFETYKFTYISIILAILMVLAILIVYQLGYDMGMQGIPPLSRISKID